MTKSSFRLIFAALAATATLAACTKEITPPSFENDKVNPAAEGTRVIAVSFSSQSQTKTTLEGFQPKFVGKEVIKVSNGTKSEKCEVKVDGDGNATFTTNLEGPLKAVYPADAAVMNGEDISGVQVKANQSGTFADANICMAKDITNEAVFENKTAVLRFYVGSEIEVTSVTLESLSEYFAPSIGQKITVEASGGKKLYDQMPDNQDRRICYVAVPYGGYEQLTITTVAKNQKPEPKKLIKCSLSAGSMYTVFIPYYIDVDGQKWGYCNIGAFLPEEPGDYFMWGEVKGHKFANGEFTNFPATNPDQVRYTGGWDSSKGFSEDNAPFYEDSGKYNKYDYKDQAAPEDDAASANWGGKWRMPTSVEFDYVIKNAVHVNGGGISLGSLFFPAAGTGDGVIRSNFGQGSSYWSNTIASGSNLADALEFYSFVDEDGKVEEKILKGFPERYLGLPIRPIYGPAPTPTEPDYVEMKMGTGDDTYTLKWRKMNLGATTVAGSYETCCGDYYAWGVTEPYYETKTWSEGKQQWDRTGFEWKDIAVWQDQDGDEVSGYRPEVYYQNSDIPAHEERIWKDEYEWNPAPYDDTKKLKQDYDAVAQANIGDGWRMPTIGEFNDLCKACSGNDDGSPELSEITSSTPGKGIYALSADQEFLPEYKGVAGLLLCDGESRLFFPTAGIIEDSKHFLGKDETLSGLYWSSTYSKEFEANCFAFNIGTYEGVNLQYPYDRHYGFPIRPVSD